MTPVGFVCAWCKRVRTSVGEWRPAQDDEADYPCATHGICPECLARETQAALAGAAALSVATEERR